MIETNKVCKYCNKNFKTNISKKTYCSQKCQLRAYSKSAKGKEIKKKIYLKNQKIIKSRSSARYKLKKEEILKKIKKKFKNRSLEEKAKYNKRQREWYKTIKGRAISRRANSKKRLIIKDQTPKWNNEEYSKKIYLLASELESLLKTKINVDHIIPLRGRSYENNAPVCGLNVWYNLMPSIASENKSKNDLCPPLKKIPGIDAPHLTLDLLPEPKYWMKFMDFIYKNAIKSMEDPNEIEAIIKNYIQLNPRKIKK